MISAEATEKGGIPSNKLLFFKLKEVVSKATLETTGHGIPRLLQSQSKIFRLLWFIALMASVCGCAYMVYVGMSNYFQFNVVTNIQVIGEQPSLFPVRFFLLKIYNY
jgi:hypothetical protein